MYDYRNRIFPRYLDTCAAELGCSAPFDAAKDYDPGLREQCLPLLPTDRAARILDIGCGRGYLLAFLKKSGYLNCRGIDLSPQMVEQSRAKGVEAEEADAVGYLRAHPGQFDCVLSFDLLEHLHKDELFQFMDLIHAALKPGGCFVAHTVNADGWTWGRMRYIDMTHEMAFTRYSLSQLFTACGFLRSEFYPCEPVVTGFRSLIRKIIWRAFRLVVNILHHAETGSGILRNDHILTSSLMAKAVKAVE
jgi:2-polyprenyl-3-methyl-5-hydroxy-6-metoxy-1,4-benzoquinol methylase